MKTAEEWQELWPEGLCNLHTKQLQAIQLDAMKEGMRRAAENVANRNAPEDCQTCLAVAKEAILTAAEQLTEKDL